jgi:hypothetical protein
MEKGNATSPSAGTWLIPEVKFTHLRSSAMKPGDERALLDRVARSRVSITDFQASSPSPNAFLFFLNRPRLSLLAFAYFPSVALAVAATVLEKEKPDILSGMALGWSGLDRKVGHKLRRLISDNLSTMVGPTQSFGVPAVIAWLALHLGDFNGPDAPFNKSLDPALTWLKQLDRLMRREKVIKPTVSALADTSHKAEDLERYRSAIDLRCKQIAEALGYSRYLETIVMAAAYAQLTCPLKVDPSPISQCVRFIDDLVVELRGTSATARAAITIERVIASYRDIHRWAEQRNLESHESDFRVVTVDETGSHPFSHFDFSALQEEILWHLAAIGQPVESDVLLACPDILLAAKNGDAPKRVEAALKLLVARCLVLRASDRKSGKPGDQESPESPPRYVIHRMLQRHIYRSMGAPYVEAQIPDRFSVSLYADQPNDAPQLNRAAHERLKRLVAGLSGFPGSDNNSPWEGDAWKKSRFLKAALGVLRNCYSVASVARFVSVGAAEAQDAERGIFTSPDISSSTVCF